MVIRDERIPLLLLLHGARPRPDQEGSKAVYVFSIAPTRGEVVRVSTPVVPLLLLLQCTIDLRAARDVLELVRDDGGVLDGLAAALWLYGHIGEGLGWC